jgi:uncharacterized protein
MHIRIADIPGDGLDVIASRGKAWFPHVLEGLDPYPLESLRLVEVSLFLRVEGRDVFAEGSYEAVGEALCDHCTEPVSVSLADSFHTVLVPPEERPAGNSHVELHEGDLEVVYHDGVSVEPASIMREQVALGLPSKVLCSDDCRGLCPRCAGNRNRGECKCPPAKAGNVFSVLESLKEKKESEDA